MILYLLCILAELMVYCYPGDIIKHKSELIARAAYFTKWTDMSVDARRLLFLLALRAQRPLTVTAGNTFELSLKTFTTASEPYNERGSTCSWPVFSVSQQTRNVYSFAMPVSPSVCLSVTHVKDF
ncbi:Odorant receptor 30a [Eumeta japonica]|uniref:Odorant receptor 30a n=1 Tax=Eumeta variegata TaxID=151549 RepID=A0A4C1XIT5_EUMVA|nr:Odorant receptor 30a [Eumeta japonica]